MIANPLRESAYNREGVLYVVSRMKWYWELVDLLLDKSSRSPSETTGLRLVLEDNVTELYRQLLLYQIKSICRYYRNRLVVFFEDLVKLGDWAGKLDDIKNTEDAIQRDSGVLNTQDMLGHLSQIPEELKTLKNQLEATIRQIQENKDNKACLQALFQTNPDDDLERIKHDKGGLLRDSYNWIIDNADFKRWQTDPTVRRLLISGDAGKGKTMLLCGIIEHLKQDDSNPLCYFFCQATVPSLSTATSVLRGLIYHLVNQYPELLVYVRRKYDDGGRKVFEDHNAWQVVSEILEAMFNDPYLDGVFVIVDALDECIVDRTKLLDFINAMSRRSRAKWIVSCRDWPEITHRFDRSRPDLNLSLTLTDELISGAVEQYINHKVEDLMAKKDMFDEKIRRQVETHLREKSGNTFLWVALVWKELDADNIIDTLHAKKVLDKSPSGLDELYERIIGQVCDQAKNWDAEPCKQILAITSVAQRLLTLQELVPLVQLDSSLVESGEKLQHLRTLIGYCGTFLHLRGEEVNFVHQSAKDFLLLHQEGKRSFSLIYPSGVADRHYRIFRRSLEVLTETLRRDICDLKDPGILPAWTDLSPPSRDRLAPLTYCCAYWVKHLAASNEGQHASLSSADLQDGGMVHDFLKKNFLCWLEALSLSKNVSQAVESIYDLASIIVGRTRLFSHLINCFR